MKQQLESVRSGFFAASCRIYLGHCLCGAECWNGLHGPCTFNASRFLIGGIVLLPVIWTKERMEAKKAQQKLLRKRINPECFLPGGVCCGIALCAASLLQQFGIRYTSVGKAGFLTTLYIVIVPLLGIFCAPHSRCEGMVQRCGCVNRNVSSMYFRKRSDRTGGWVGDRLRVCIFHSYSGGGSFCRAGGWRKAFVSAVSDERRHLSGACVFDGASVLECIVCRNRAGFIRGRSVQRRWVYASGCRTEKSGSQQRHPCF